MTKSCSTCPYNKTFVFTGKCQINSCQFHNTKTQRNCIALDLSSSSGTRADGAVTDLFLLNFKILPNAKAFEAKTHNEKFAEYSRKKAVTATLANMTLYLFSHWIKAKLKPSDNFTYIKGQHSLIDNLLNSFPLNQVELKFEPWMLYYAANQKAYEAFIREQNRKDDSVALVHVLGLTPGKHTQLIEAIKSFKPQVSKNKTRRKA